MHLSRSSLRQTSRIAPVLVWIGVVILLLLALPRPAPSFANRPPSFWLAQLDLPFAVRDPATAPALAALRSYAVEELGRRLTARDGLLREMLVFLSAREPRLHLGFNSADADRQAAAEAVIEWADLRGELGPELAQALRLARRASAQDAAGRALLAIGPEAAGPLVALSGDPDAAVQRQALRWLEVLLRRHGRPAGWSPVLAAALTHLVPSDDPAVALAAVTTLALLGEDAEVAVPALIEQQRAADARIRVSVATALGAIRRDEARSVPALAAQLADPAEDVRAAAAAALGGFGPRAATAVPALAALAQHPRTPLAVAAANALGRIGRPAASAIPKLALNLDRPAAQVRASSAGALGRIADNALVAVPPLARLLRDSEEHVRLTAARSLGAFGPDASPALDELITALWDPVESVRIQAALALGGIGPEAREAIPFLEAARNNNPSVMNPPVIAALAQIEAREAAR